MHPHLYAFASALALAILPLASAPAQGQSAEALWTSNCISCHGERGQGGNAQPLLDEDWLLGPTDKDLFAATGAGIVESGMPAYGDTLKDEQIWALVVHIRELRARDKRDRLGSPKPDSAGVYSTQHAKFKIEQVITGGLDVPWSVDFLPPQAPPNHASGAMLVTNRSGALQLWTGADNGGLSRPVSGTPDVRNRGQGGLMDVAVHPEYAANGWIYLSFSEARGRNGFTHIVRGKIRADGDDWRWTDHETIFEARPDHYTGGDIHFGNRIVFQRRDNAPDGSWLVFFCIGERGMMDLAQRLDRPNGKVYRLFDDGRVPDDNPFVTEDDAYKAIWSYGHRNPQGLAFDLEGRLWDTEHGPRGGDELNLIQKARNYGWPIVSFGINYSDAPFRTPWPSEDHRITMPTFVWIPSIAACGLDTVRPGRDGEAFPAWKGDLVAGGLAGQTVERLRISGETLIEREELIHGMGRVRDVVTGPDGSIYVVLNQPDHVIRLVPTR